MNKTFPRTQLGKFASRLRCLATALVLLMATVCLSTRADNLPQPSPTRLFNERDLQGWRPAICCDAKLLTAQERETLAELATQDMSVHWQAAFGILQYDGAGKPIETEQTFGPCRLSFQWKCEPCSSAQIGLPGGWSVAIGDAPSDGDDVSHASGAIYDGCRRVVKPTLCADRPLGEWNQMMIYVRRHQIDVWLNGRRIAISDEFSTEIAGPMTLGGGPAPLYFRNLLVEPLDDSPSEPNPPLP
ncbi:DUF1080 domain-containing protein [Blastopirellula sp. J2-11]|uniref:3-keto-disaccharide hydrolase n=1 Tax=Blastopirellula sp. J2-11 TaxID=2943192 RepID=UPI0021CA2F2A|nr:DUF1080 domain-containing protein [Blastopirellula sp. J2-11]UUO05754.1 DUF1080 domain-containing protein [Blastopirellula sp. J2-11]